MPYKLPDDVKKVMDESYYQRLKKPIKVVRLPCADNHRYKEPVLVELFEPRDQRLRCPKCGKEHFLVWQAVSGNKFA